MAGRPLASSQVLQPPPQECAALLHSRPAHVAVIAGRAAATSGRLALAALLALRQGMCAACARVGRLQQAEHKKHSYVRQTSAVRSLASAPRPPRRHHRRPPPPAAPTAGTEQGAMAMIFWAAHAPRVASQGWKQQQQDLPSRPAAGPAPPHLVVLVVLLLQQDAGRSRAVRQRTPLQAIQGDAAKAQCARASDGATRPGHFPSPAHLHLRVLGVYRLICRGRGSGRGTIFKMRARGPGLSPAPAPPAAPRPATSGRHSDAPRRPGRDAGPSAGTGRGEEAPREAIGSRPTGRGPHAQARLDC